MKSIVADIIRHQLAVQGHAITEEEARDVASQVVMCIATLDATDEALKAAHLAQPLVDLCEEERDAISEVFAEVRAAVSKLEQERDWSPAQAVGL